jgi:LacI family transcriptional regulator
VTITIKDVAERAGVSPKTVSRVMNGEAHVRPALREAVKRVVAELDYRPNAFARSLASSRSYLLGLFIDDPAWSSYATGLQRGALTRCREQHYHLVVEPIDILADTWEPLVSHSIATLRLDGAILTPPVCQHGPMLEKLEALGLPYVRVSPGEYPARSGMVEIDEEGAAFEMTRHLIDLGHRDIGFLEGIPSHSATPKRRAGFVRAMRTAGLPVAEGWIAPGDFTFRSGLESGGALLRHRSRPSAIFASNDEMAFGVSVAASKLGIAVPSELSIAGFDDSPTARIAWPQITTVRQPVERMAAAAVDILIDPAYRNAIGDPHFHRQLPFEIVIRGSTAPIGAASSDPAEDA